jgi:hypothetical protein
LLQASSLAKFGTTTGELFINDNTNVQTIIVALTAALILSPCIIFRGQRRGRGSIGRSPMIA